MFIFQACYEDFKFDYEYTTTYFAVQKPLRTVMIEEGEDLTMEVGVMLGGKYFNDQDWTVDYEIVPSMLDSIDNLSPLPSDYYTLSDPNKFVIKEGEYMGIVTVTFTDKFLADPSATGLQYALPFKITNSSTDSILAGMDSTIVAIQYHNQYFGAYWTKGVDETLDASGNVKDTTFYNEADLVTNEYVIFETLSKDIAVVPHVGSDFRGKDKLNMEIASDGTVNISTGEVSKFTNISGSGNYDKENKTFTLDYTYMNGSEKHHVVDTLIWFDSPFKMEEW